MEGRDCRELWINGTKKLRQQMRPAFSLVKFQKCLGGGSRVKEGIVS